MKTNRRDLNKKKKKLFCNACEDPAKQEVLFKAFLGWEEKDVYLPNEPLGSEAAG